MVWSRSKMFFELLLVCSVHHRNVQTSTTKLHARSSNRETHFPSNAHARTHARTHRINTCVALVFSRKIRLESCPHCGVIIHIYGQHGRKQNTSILLNTAGRRHHSIRFCSPPNDVPNPTQSRLDKNTLHHSYHVHEKYKRAAKFNSNFRVTIRT